DVDAEGARLEDLVAGGDDDLLPPACEGAEQVLVLPVVTELDLDPLLLEVAGLLRHVPRCELYVRHVRQPDRDRAPVPGSTLAPAGAGRLGPRPTRPASAEREHSERERHGADDPLTPHHCSLLSSRRTSPNRAMAASTSAPRTASIPVVSPRSRYTASSCPRPCPPMTNSPTTAPVTESTKPLRMPARIAGRASGNSIHASSVKVP